MMRLPLTLALLVGIAAALNFDTEKRGVGNQDLDLDEREVSVLTEILKRKLDENKRESEKKKELAEKEKLRGLIRRVIGGQEVNDGAWPWLVSLQAELPTKKIWRFTVSSAKFYCGASLINRRWILTAAHCFDLEDAIPSEYRDEVSDPENYVARLGDKDLESSWWEKIVGLAGDVINKDEWKLKDWEIEGEKIFIHPGYDRRNKWKNDIALMKLSEEAPAQPDYIEEIQAVVLGEDRNFPTAGQKCIFKGWGCKKSGGRVSSTAFQVELPAVDNDECEDLWKIDTRDRLCAGHNLAGMGICPGDSGGPLVCKAGNTWVQVGLASFTAAQHPGQYPGAFTRISSYTNWIKSTIRNN